LLCFFWAFFFHAVPDRNFPGLSRPFSLGFFHIGRRANGSANGFKAGRVDSIHRLRKVLTHLLFFYRRRTTVIPPSLSELGLLMRSVFSFLYARTGTYVSLPPDFFNVVLQRLPIFSLYFFQKKEREIPDKRRGPPGQGIRASKDAFLILF